jgi:hypothetical protein
MGREGDRGRGETERVRERGIEGETDREGRDRERGRERGG